MILRPGNYHTIPATADPAGAAVVANTIVALPLFIPKSYTLAKLAVRVTTLSAGQNIRVALYVDSGAGKPGLLVAESGALSTASTGLKEGSISAAGSAGLHWLCYVCSSAVPAVSSFTNTQIDNLLGLDSTSLARITRLERAFTYAAFPADESAQTYSNSTSAQVPALMFVVA
jgi:hypothetical protein